MTEGNVVLSISRGIIFNHKFRKLFYINVTLNVTKRLIAVFNKYFISLKIYFLYILYNI